MDQVDRDILNLIQSGFPITARPYQVLGDELGLPEQEVIDRVKRMKECRIIRRIGANFQSSKMGFTSTLCAAKVPEEAMDQFVAVVNAYPGVTHNYRRDHQYNVWFTFIAESMDLIDQYLEEIKQKTGVTQICNLPAKKLFKIKVDFPV
ncbi:MAG: AsnC family transcriptional regulator [Deltaproteobacteria bacterium]|nr:AsnC family transcriptional regulator [Deltaproteobacteria bacterium]